MKTLYSLITHYTLDNEDYTTNSSLVEDFYPTITQTLAVNESILKDKGASNISFEVAEYELKEMKKIPIIEENA